MGTSTLAARGKSRKRAGNPGELLRRATEAHNAGRIDEAADRYRRILEKRPNQPDALHLSGVIAFQQGDFDSAIDLISRALTERPAFPQALNNLGNVLLAAGRLDEAERTYRAALKSRPDYPDARANLATVLAGSDRAEQAVIEARRAVGGGPDVAHYHATLGNALASAGRDDEALASLERAVALSPDDPDFAAARAGVLARLGRHDEARGILEAVLKARPDSLRALTAIAGMKKVSADDALPGLFRQASRSIGSQPFQRQVGFFFAWGKLLDDIGECDNAFRCLETANQLQREIRCYHRDAYERGIEAVQQFFAGMSAGPCDDAHPGDRPVFVVGMPRSGTTLTEQVIAAHPRALGAGELTTLEESLSEAAGIRRPNVADLYQHLAARSEAEVAAAMRAYLGEIDRLGGDRARVVDKMPGNFVHIGLIRRFLPNARIVHVVRNPVDTLLSCFQQNFERGQAFSNELADAAHYYHLYAKLMDFWREREPGALFTVRYEDLVGDPEPVARAMMDHVGLEWDPGCLAPHRLGRSVRTASQWQVRQPVYTSSVGRWRRYEKQLRPLLDRLDGYGIDWRD